MATKLRHLYPSAALPSMHAKSGRQESEPIPLRWLESLVQELRAAVETETEKDSIEVFGAQHLRAVFTDDLSESEVMRDELASLRAQLATAEARIRELEGKAAPPTTTPDAPMGHTYGPSDVTVAAPADRQQVFLNWFVQSGWKLPDHDAAVWLGVLQQGVTHAEAEQWLRLTPGYFTTVGHERGLKAP